MEAISAQMIEQFSTNLNSGLDASINHLRTLEQLIPQYKSTLQDLFSMKQKYLDIVAKYSENMIQKTNPSLFTGVVAAAPMYSISEMQVNSTQLEEMGKLVQELEEQKQMIYAQIRQLIRSTVDNVASASDTAEQIDLFLSQAIFDSGNNGVYGSQAMRAAVESQLV